MSLDASAPRQSRSLLNNARVRGLALQAVLLLLLAAFFYDLALNTMDNMATRHIVSGFGFLWRKAGFEVSFSLIPYSGEDNYARALMVGFFNTLLVSAIGIVLATVLGLVIGLMRLSRNWLASRMAAVGELWHRFHVPVLSCLSDFLLRQVVACQFFGAARSWQTCVQALPKLRNPPIKDIGCN